MKVVTTESVASFIIETPTMSDPLQTLANLCTILGFALSIYLFVRRRQ
ncbi:hypothetical protein N7403_26445 [Pseudomonas nitroreducens]|nr:hypothetical protein [Pseudomonas nitroreducens]ELN4693816.1 hypothetical protein [Escherichia coli]MDG9857404.1 hypothetical protein [Pseudomonas nitroreducens]